MVVKFSEFLLFIFTSLLLLLDNFNLQVQDIPRLTRENENGNLKFLKMVLIFSYEFIFYFRYKYAEYESLT